VHFPNRSAMRVEEIESDVLMFVGDAYESVATAFLCDGDALLIDTLASHADAEWMRRSLDQMGKTVRTVIATHYMNDHMAGMRLYPKAQIIAQRYFRYTFESQRRRSAQDNEDYVNPTAVFGDRLSLQWGRHALQLFHNPGKTMCSVNIDAPSCDAVFAGDNIVGNIIYLSRSSPGMIDHAIARLQLLQRGRVIGGHMGMFDKLTLSHARHYLGRLREIVVDNYLKYPHDLAIKAVQSIKIESCLAPGVVPTPFEREWHGRNLDVMQEQGTFELEATQEAMVSKPSLSLDHVA
jgi:cyclase